MAAGADPCGHRGWAGAIFSAGLLGARGPAGVLLRGHARPARPHGRPRAGKGFARSISPYLDLSPLENFNSPPNYLRTLFCFFDDAAIEPLLGPFATGEFNSPPN
eukprot:1706987-Pyramimonas_sp.AAC.1